MYKYRAIIFLLFLLIFTGFGIKKKENRTQFFPKAELRPTSIPKKENVWVFILAGQSNMAGRGLVEPQDTLPHERIFAINKKNDLILAKQPVHFYEPNMAGLDCGLSFANTLLNDVPDSISILIIPTAIGGSSIIQWIDDLNHRNVNLYSNFREKLKVGQGYGIVKAVLWHQGESDASGEKIEIYADQLRKLFESFRNDADNLILPILIGELASFPRNYENRQAINSKIREYIATDPHAYLIKTYDLNHKGDSTHFDSEALRKMGIRFAEKFKEIEK